MTDIWAQITFARTQTQQILQALSSDVTVTVACLIKARDEEADSHGAVGQEVKRQSLEKLKEDLFFSSFPRHIYTTCPNFTQQPEPEWFGSIFESVYSGYGISQCTHIKHLEMNEFWLWHGWSVRLIWGLITTINQCQESDQSRLASMLAYACPVRACSCEPPYKPNVKSIHF